jgi:hypothetical protein
LARFPNLKAALDAAYIRTLKGSAKLDTMIFSTSRQSVDDFIEILLMCRNGGQRCGEAAAVLLRTGVLVSYLNKNPEQLDAYYDYYHVTTK